MKKKFRSVMLSFITAGAALAGSMSTASAVESTNTNTKQETKISEESRQERAESLAQESSSHIKKWTDNLNLSNRCPANVILYIPPSGSSSIFSSGLAPHFGGVHQQVTMNDYPKNVVISLPYNAMWTTGLFTYNESRNSGIRNAKTSMSSIHSQCPGAKIHIYGYSEGADVGAHIVNSISQGRGPIPKRNLGSAVFQGNPVRNIKGTHSAGTAGPGKGLFTPVDYGDQAGKVMEMCNLNDIVCNTSSMAPNLYYLYEDTISNSAPLRGKYDIKTLLQRITPKTAVRAGLEFPNSLMGWYRHSTDYYLWTPWVRNQGERFIKSHYA